MTSTTVTDWIRERRVYVAEIDDEIVGGVRLETTGTDRIKLSRLGVHEDHKGEGIGSELLNHAEKRARNRGYASIHLTTPAEHPYLPAFYRHRGYQKTGEYSLEYREYDEIVMEKRFR